jgi:hypothetical protein
VRELNADAGARSLCAEQRMNIALKYVDDGDTTGKWSHRDLRQQVVSPARVLALRRANA